MAAILYVEAKQHAEETKKVHGDLTIAPDEDNAEYKQKLDELLEEFSDRFDEQDFTPSNMPPVDIKIKED